MGETVRAPSPRIVGGLLLVLSGVVGVFAAATIPHPAWGILAAIVLAAASVGALAGLLLLFRRGWADKMWPPGMRFREWNPARQRRVALIYGVFLLLVSGALLVGLVTGGVEPDGSRSWALLVLTVVLSVALIVSGILRPRRVVDPSGRPEDDDRADAEGWVRLGADGSAVSTTFSLPGTSLGGWAIWLIVLLPILTRAATWGILVAILIVAVGAAVAVLVARRFRRSPEVAGDGSALRHRGRTIAAGDVTAARLVAIPVFDTAVGRSITLVLDAAGRHTPIGLRKNGRLTLGEAATRALVAFLERSAIEIPRDKEDPRGRFSAVLYPTHLTREAAVALAADPPADGETLPLRHAPIS